MQCAPGDNGRCTVATIATDNRRCTVATAATSCSRRGFGCPRLQKFEKSIAARQLLFSHDALDGRGRGGARLRPGGLRRSARGEAFASRVTGVVGGAGRASFLRTEELPAASAAEVEFVPAPKPLAKEVFGRSCRSPSCRAARRFYIGTGSRGDLEQRRRSDGYAASRPSHLGACQRYLRAHLEPPL